MYRHKTLCATNVGSDEWNVNDESFFQTVEHGESKQGDYVVIISELHALKLFEKLVSRKSAPPILNIYTTCIKHLADEFLHYL